MFHVLEKRIAEAFSAQLKELYGLEMDVQTEQPKQASFGEVAIPSAFQLARTLRKAPRAIATELAEAAAGKIEGVAGIEIAGNGYLNVRLDRGAYGRGLIGPHDTGIAPISAGKIIVEHTNINPNKAAHIGHLRNAILGDTFVRMLRATGSQVEVQNVIDNTGVQVADVVVGFRHLEGKTVEKVQALIDDPHVRFDYYCWDLYAKVSQHYQNDPEALEWRKQTLHEIESGEGEVAELGHLVADAIVQTHLATMLRLGIEYDVLPRESEILHLNFWAKAFAQLQERKAIYYEEEGKNKGCWVMPASAFRKPGKDANTGAKGGDAQGEGNSNEPDEVVEEDSAEDSKVLVRSNGTVTYVGKDIAYQMWKFGLLGLDFGYRPLYHYPSGHTVWVTSTVGDPDAPSFGGGARVYNVIDSRQSYLQDVVVAGLRALDYNEQADASVHFSYEMVALSPRTCVELGIALSEEDQKKAYVEVSGRKGLGVKADDLIDKLIEKLVDEVGSRNPERHPDEIRRTASRLAVGALRYFMLKYTRNAVIAFDFGEALAFTGEAGIYVQYAAVRAAKILEKATAAGHEAVEMRLSREVMARQLADENLWQYVLLASKADAAIEAAVQSGEPAHVARYAFQLAQLFSNFYDKYPVVDEPDEEKRTFLIWFTGYFRKQLERTLGVLGIQVPEYM